MDVFEIENEFYRQAHPSRFSKFLAHAKLYEMSLGLPGDFVECGVFKGASFCRFRKLASLFHPDHARKFVGFDVFGRFPDADIKEDEAELQRQFTIDGDTGIDVEELRKIIKDQGLDGNVELVKGDVRVTLPEYFNDHQDMALSIVNIDLDLYGPVKVALEVLFPKVVRGGIIILDDYAAGFPGANKAVEEFMAENGRKERIQKFPWTYTPAFIIKE